MLQVRILVSSRLFIVNFWRSQNYMWIFNCVGVSDATLVLFKAQLYLQNLLGTWNSLIVKYQKLNFIHCNMITTEILLSVKKIDCRKLRFYAMFWVLHLRVVLKSLKTCYKSCQKILMLQPFGMANVYRGDLFLWLFLSTTPRKHVLAREWSWTGAYLEMWRQQRAVRIFRAQGNWSLGLDFLAGPLW